jgi:MYXO-CTERM domain-containing protein
MFTNQALSILTAAVVTAAISTAHAAIITPTDATSTSYIGSGGRTIDKTIDGSGLSSGGLSGDVLSETHSLVYEDGNDHYWLSARDAGRSGNEVLTFDLGEAFDVDAVHIWQYAIANDTRRQIANADLTFSSDGVNYGDLRQVSFSSVSATTLNSQSRTFSTVSNVTHIKMVVTNSSDYIGLSEIRFGGTAAVPEPASLAMGLLGLALIAGRRRR